MVTLQKSGDSAVKFVFTDSDHYLYGNGELEVPVNSLMLVIDESEMVTFKKLSGDPFISFRADNSNLGTKAAIEEFYKTNMVGSTGGSESGITSGDVESMIDDALADYYTDDEVDAALSGKQDTLRYYTEDSDGQAMIAVGNGYVEVYDNYAHMGVDNANLEVMATGVTINDEIVATQPYVSASLSGKADTSAVTAVENDVLTLQDALAGKANTAALTAHTSDTDIHVTQADKTSWNAKAEPYSAGTGIEISGNVISATAPQGDYYEQVSGLTIEYNSDSQTPEVLLQGEGDEQRNENVFNRWGIATSAEMEDGSSYSSGLGGGTIYNNASDHPDENVTSERNLEITTDGFRQTIFENYDDGESGYTRYSSENEFNYSNGLTLSQQWYDPENDEITTSTIEINNNDGTSIHFTDGSDELDLNNQMFDWTDGTDSRSIRWGDIASLNDIPEYSAGTGIEISGNVISATGGGVTVDPTLDTGSTNPVANSAITTAIDVKADKTGCIGVVQINNQAGNYKSSLLTYNGVGSGGQAKGYFGGINGSPIATQFSSEAKDFQLVEKSAITSAITSASTNAEVAGAKAVYDAIQAGGGGGGSVTVDSSLDPDSNNPVANSAITFEIDNLAAMVDVKADQSEMYYLLDGSTDENDPVNPVRLMRISQSDYDALADGEGYDPDVLYIITPDEENEGGE